jgi:hypothetical protein
MANLTIVAARVAVAQSIEQATRPCGEAIVAGQYIRPNTTTGKWELGNATNAGEVGQRGAIATKSVAIGEALTGLYKGLMDVGDALTADAYDAPIYLSDTDGTLAQGAGTVSKVVGTVQGVFTNGSGVADKLLLVNL